MLGMTHQVMSTLRSDPRAVHTRDEHGRTPLDAATLLDNFRAPDTTLHEKHDTTAITLIEYGARADLEHLAALGLTAEVEKRIAEDPDIISRPRLLKALPGGAAIRESPLQAARRRGYTDIVNLFLRHNATDRPDIMLW
jgi:ankyrin repeat protein